MLIVDDNRDFAQTLTNMLAAVGYDVTFSIDGVSGLERLRERTYDAAILDLGLPVLDGFELARKIRAEHGACSPRLIALTGYGQERDRARTSDAGFDAHLVKPVDIAAVIDAVEHESARLQARG